MATVSGGSTGSSGSVTLPVGEDGAPLYSKDGAVVSDANADLRSKSLQAQEEVGTSGSLAGGAITISNDSGTVIADDEEVDHSAQDEPIKWSQIFWVKDLLASAAEGRLDLTTAGKGASISWPAGKRISLQNADGVLDLITPSAALSFVNTALDINSTALAGGTTPYAVYLEHNGTVTGADVVLVPWTNATTRSVALADWCGFKVYDNTTDAGKQRRHIGDILPRIHWNPAAAWSALTTYYNGEQATEGGHTFISLASNNLNHATSDTDWWDDCGESPGDGRGMFADETQFRLVLNAYNQETKDLGVACPYTANTSEVLSNITTPRAIMIDGNGNTVWLTQFLSDGKSNSSLIVTGISGGSYISIGIAVDTLNTYAQNSSVSRIPIYTTSVAQWTDVLTAGYHSAVPVVESNGTPIITYWVAADNVQYDKTQFLGTWRG